jgi:hypothetical protein
VVALVLVLFAQAASALMVAIGLVAAAVGFGLMPGAPKQDRQHPQHHRLPILFHPAADPQPPI